MAQGKTRGLAKRGGTWHIDKVVRGRRICESSGTGDLKEAERYLARRMEEIRKAVVYGERPRRTFRQAATRYLGEARKATLWIDALQLKMLEPYIGNLHLEAVHMGALQPFIEARRKEGVKNRTINYGIQTARRVLNCAMEWLDENGMSWIPHVPRFKFLPETDKRDPYPISWAEQFRLFGELPGYLAKMALFAVNTGLRDQEICGLRWEYEYPVPEMDTSVFIIPKERIKNREDRLLVLNRVAKAVVEEMRGVHPVYVFSYRGKRIAKMYGRAWREGRKRAGLEQVRVHDLRHTWGRRLRAAGVSFEDRQDLLGHTSKRITTHYSQAELGNLIASANKVCDQKSRKSPALVILKKKIRREILVNVADS